MKKIVLAMAVALAAVGTASAQTWNSAQAAGAQALSSGGAVSSAPYHALSKISEGGAASAHHGGGHRGGGGRHRGAACYTGDGHLWHR
jgi:hypothetical protein